MMQSQAHASHPLLDRLLARPELQAVATPIAIDVTTEIDAAFIVPSPDRLIISPKALAQSDSAVVLRHGLELAWLRTVLPHRPAVCGVIAARVAAVYQAMEPPTLATQANTAAPSFSADGPKVWPSLSAHQPGADPSFTQTDEILVAAAWPWAAPVEHLMIVEEDARLAVDPVTGLNRYGCRPRPQPNVVTFSSCTASSISERGYVAAEANRRSQLQAALTVSSAALARESRVIETRIAAYFGVDEIAEAVLAPSGTDATLLATAMIAARYPSTQMTAVLMSLTETGNSIPEAATGRAGATMAPITPAVAYAIGHLAARPHLRPLAVRDQTGMPRAHEDIEADIAAEIKRATTDGVAIVHAVDLSKTGLLAPRADFISDISRNAGNAVHVVVDACQARVGRRQIQRYLRDGAVVVVTGSKFYTGPPFSGAVLVPRARFPGFSRDLAPDPGTLLRWAAALAEMAAFAAVPVDEQTTILQRFGDRIRRGIAANQRLVAFPTPPPLRPENDGWDRQQSIFVFAVRDPAAPERFLDFATLGRIQRWLYSDISDRLQGSVAARICRLGQPVRLGEGVDHQIAGLRIAAGARLVSGEPSHVLRGGEHHIDREIADLDDVMTKLGLILDNLPALIAAEGA